MRVMAADMLRPVKRIMTMNNPNQFKKYISHGNAIHHGLQSSAADTDNKSGKLCFLMIIVVTSGSLGVLAANLLNGGF